MNRIEEALLKKFESHRVIFWFDDAEEMREHFNSLDLNGIERFEVDNNEFQLKHLILKGDQTKKILLYFPFGERELKDNWLLDLQLAHETFRTDQESLYLQEIGLDYHYKELVTQHLEFFQNKDRRTKLQEQLAEGDGANDIRYKMLAVLFNAVYVNLEAFLQAYATSFNDNNDKLERELERFGLKEFFWKEVARKFDYHNETPSIYDFLLEVFGRNFSMTQKGRSAKESRILISLWKDAISYQESYQALSKRIADDLSIESLLNSTSIEDIIDEDTFHLIDVKIIHQLIELVEQGLINEEKLLAIIKRRQSRYWFKEYANLYACIEHAGQLINKVTKAADVKFSSLESGVENYSSTLFQVDFHFRKFILSYRSASHNRALDSLYKKVSRIYSNDWLLSINNRWQSVLDQSDDWIHDTKVSQSRFFKQWVFPYTSKKQRLFVIISDALRFECGWEYFKQVQSEQRYEAAIDFMVTGLPSYTQLGMASLLPHEQLSIANGTDDVISDGAPTKGVIARSNILQAKSGVRATAINAEDFMKMSSHGEGREFVKANDLIYIYHNRIDKVGDDKTSEEKVFEAVEAEIDYLKEMIKKIANMNGNNILITADHGFIYQHEDLEESDFSDGGIEGTVWKESRRFVIGKDIKGNPSLLAFNGKQVGLTSDVDLLIPKSINRLRIKGSGSKYVHGGASLQEVVIPVISVSKKREDTTKKVDIDIIKSTDRITTNILAVSFLQKELVSDKVLARTLRIYLQAEDGAILSDIFNYTFNATEGTERQREVKHRYQLSSLASGKYKNQRVKLILEEPLEGSTKWRSYGEYLYTLNISFTNDFDDL